MERKDGEGPLCFGLSPLPFAQRDVAKGAGGGKCCPTGQALEGQQGAKIHQAPGGRACAKMASKTNGTTRWGWAGGAGSLFTPHSWRYHHEERTELWLRSGCSRARAVQPRWGWGHVLPLALGKEGEKSHGKSAGGLCKWTRCPPVCMAPGPDRWGFTCSRCSWSCTIPVACEAAQHRRGRQQTAQTKITPGFYL